MHFKNFNITSAKAIIIHKGEAYDTQAIENNIGLPCFVKPNRAGSSFGVSKVTASEQWEQAIKEAFKHDNQVLIEAFIDGIEVTCGLIEKEGELIALPLTEITTENDFFDYEAKYEGKSQEITPARVSDEIKEQVQSISKKIYNTLHLKGLVRMDYIVEKDQAYLIEINTIPACPKKASFRNKPLVMASA